MLSSHVEKRYEKNKLEQYIVDILSLGLNENFFPPSIVNSGDEILVSYDTSGYTKLSSIESLNLIELLWIIKNIVKIIKKCENNFILLSKYKMSSDEIYLDEKNKIVKIIYDADDRHKNIAKILMNIAIDFENKINGDYIFYDKLVEILKKEKVDTRSIIKNISYLEESIAMESEYN